MLLLNNQPSQIKAKYTYLIFRERKGILNYYSNVISS